MKFNHKNLLVLAAVASLTSCNKFLEVQPDSNRATINTPEQVSQLLISAYPQGNYITMVEAMSNNAGDKKQGTDDVTNRMTYKFEVVNSSPNNQDAPDLVWAEAYKAISSANHALDVINKAKNPSLFSAQKGEALLARAYSHLMLVSMFSQFYDPAHADKDMGIPYVDEPETEVFKQYDRKTVAYVYDRIEQDILEGLPLIEDKSYDVPKYHFNRQAANAFASRFYLYKRDYQKALEYANAVYSDGSIEIQLRPWTTEWLAFDYESIWKNYNRASTTSNLLLAETYSLWGRSNWNYRYGYTTTIFNDIVKVKAIASSPTFIFETKAMRLGNNNVFIPKLGEFFATSSVNANFGQPLVMVPLLDAEEVLFNRMEANAQLGHYAEVLKDMNIYVKSRVQTYNASRNEVTEAKINTYGAGLPLKEAYIKAILDLKRLEYTFQGQRYFDLQRHGLPITHFYDESGVITSITVEARDNRRVFQIPPSATLSGVQLNPR